jgi:hypothetical protein
MALRLVRYVVQWVVWNFEVASLQMFFAIVRLLVPLGPTKFVSRSRQ